MAVKAARRGTEPGARPPAAAAAVLALIVICCLFAELLMPYDPGYMRLEEHSLPPSAAHLFGTDSMGRDIFSMIWQGGRLSLFIGCLASLISAVMGVLYGAACAFAPDRLDALLLRILEIIMSVPGLLLTVLLQAALGGESALGMALAIGATGWMSIARTSRTLIAQVLSSEYVKAARCIGGGFFHILLRHLTPNITAPIMFMVIMNIRGAIIAESTLSFMGLGLPLETVSLGSMLALADYALISGEWWTIVFPGLFLTAVILSLTSMGNHLRAGGMRRGSNLNI